MITSWTGSPEKTADFLWLYILFWFSFYVLSSYEEEKQKKTVIKEREEGKVGERELERT